MGGDAVRYSTSDSTVFLLQIWSVLSHNSGSANAHAHLDGLWRQRPRRIVEITGSANTDHASLQARARLPANYSTTLRCGIDTVQASRSCRRRWSVPNCKYSLAPEHPAKGRQAFRLCVLEVCQYIERAGFGGAKTGHSGAVLSRR